MKKANPLFVDSTRFNGDAIFTQVELEKIPPYLGETVSIVVTDKAGDQQEVPLERTGETQCSGQVFLRHQQEITYQFFVSRNGEKIFYSEPKSGRASYLIQEIWSPVAVNPAADLLSEDAPVPESLEPTPEPIAGSPAEPVMTESEIPEAAGEALIAPSMPLLLCAAKTTGLESAPEPVPEPVPAPAAAPVLRDPFEDPYDDVWAPV